jgi:hypothetical protein
LLDEQHVGVTAVASEDDAQLAAIAGRLADDLEARIRPWLVRSILTRGAGAVDRATATVVADSVANDVMPRLRQLLGTDVDEQRTNPLSIIRSSLGPATAVLASHGVPPAERDPFVARAFPDDVYDLSPAAFADIDESLREPALIWGAAKAHVHLSRRREQGMR